MPDSTSRVQGYVTGADTNSVVGDVVGDVVGGVVGDIVVDALDDFIGGGDTYWTVECKGTETTANTYIDVQEAEFTTVRSIVASASTPAVTEISQATNLYEAAQCVFGVYQPMTEEVAVYYNGQLVTTTEQVVDGIAGVNFTYISGVIVYSIFAWKLLSFVNSIFGSIGRKF